LLGVVTAASSTAGGDDGGAGSVGRAGRELQARANKKEIIKGHIAAASALVVDVRRAGSPFSGL